MLGSSAQSAAGRRPPAVRGDEAEPLLQRAGERTADGARLPAPGRCDGLGDRGAFRSPQHGDQGCLLGSFARSCPAGALCDSLRLPWAVAARTPGAVGRGESVARSGPLRGFDCLPRPWLDFERLQARGGNEGPSSSKGAKRR